jgi:hypothetical protein
VRSLLPRTTARFIDRLSRRAHRFHRFAHHPLCDRYAGERVQIGHVRLCRGCTFAIIGGIGGGFVGLAIGASSGAAAIAIAIATTLLFATLWSTEPRARAASGSPRRVGKTWTRLVPAALYAIAFTCGVFAASPLGFALAAAAVAIVGLVRVLYGRRGADRTPCTTCPELGLSPCSGFARIVSRERAFQRVATRMLGDQAQRIDGHFRRRSTHRAIALASQPVLEVAVVQPDDAADFEDRQRISSPARHISAPALRPAQREGDAFPSLDEIRH